MRRSVQVIKEEYCGQQTLEELLMAAILSNATRMQHTELGVIADNQGEGQLACFSRVEGGDANG